MGQDRSFHYQTHIRGPLGPTWEYTHMSATNGDFEMVSTLNGSKQVFEAPGPYYGPMEPHLGLYTYFGNQSFDHQTHLGIYTYFGNQ